MAKTLDGLVIPTVASNVQQAVKMKNGNIGKVSQEVMENGKLTNYSESMVNISTVTNIIYIYFQYKTWTKYFTSKYINIFHIVVPPRKVALVVDGISTSQYILKIQEEGERSLSIDCIAKQSAPTPVFEWQLNGKNID